MKNKILIILLMLFSLNIVVSAKTYNVPKYNEDIENPGSGSGLSTPVTKFDIFSNDETEETNYALTRIINIKPNETKTLTLDFYTIEWYGKYPTQVLTFEINNKEIVDINYLKDGVTAGNVEMGDTSKTITDKELPERIIDKKINTSFPTLSFSLSALKEGLTILKINVISTFEYGVEQRTDSINILINVSDEELINIPSYINISLGSNIHSGAKNIRYEENEKIGILTDIINSININLPDEVVNYNSTSTNTIKHRILTDNKISVYNDVLSFNDITSVASFTVEYYMIDSSNESIEIASYGYTCVFYNSSDITIGYDNKNLPSDEIYEIGKAITINTNDQIRPYIEDLVVAYTKDESLNILPYENENLYVFKPIETETTIYVGDKLLIQSGLENYSIFEPFLTLNLRSDNVIEREYPSIIGLEDEYFYKVDNNFTEYIEINNIDSFPLSTTFQITIDGPTNISFTSDRKIKMEYKGEKSIEYTIKNFIRIEALLENGTTLTKEISVYFVPLNGYKYTFDTLRVKMYVGEKKTIMLGKMDPYFTEAEADIYVSFYLKNGNAIIINNENRINCFDIFGYTVGNDTGYFVVNDQVIEVDIEIDKPNAKKTVTFSFLEGEKLTTLISKDKIELSIPEEYSFLKFEYIIFDETVASIESISYNKLAIKGLKEGSTQLFAYAQDENIFYSAVVNIKIMESLPTVKIIYDKDDDLTTLTKFDNIKISFDANDFIFSSSTTYSWFLNGELLYENMKSFEKKFNVGLNTLKLVIKDEENAITIETTQDINISAVENENKTIKINSDNVIYIDVNQGAFELETLVDGVINPNYKYLWILSNTNVCKIDINGNEKIIIEPINIGETDLTVMTNISQYEEVYIKSDIKIVVINPTYKIEYNNFIKPGTNQRFRILGNEKRIYNLKTNVHVECDNVDYNDYYMEDNEIVMDSIQRGNFVLNVEINGEKIAINFESTNFNLREMAIVILPYLIVICLVVLFISFVLKKRKNKLERTKKKIKILQAEVDKALENNLYTNKEVHQILHDTIVVKKMLTYCIDEGIDELSTIMPNVDKLIKILVSTINSSVDSDKIHMIIKNIKNRNIETIVKAFNVIQEERNEFEAKKKVVDEIVKKDKKIKMTKEEYESFLIQSKYMDGDEE